METTLIIIKTTTIIIGFSSAFVNNFLAFRFLKDFEVDKKEWKIFMTLAGITLLSSLLILLTIILSIAYKISFISQEVLVSSSLILLVVVFNEFVFRNIMDRLVKYRLNSKVFEISKIIFMRRVAFSLNIISVVSWVYLLLIFQFNLININFITEVIIGDYILVSSLLVIAVNIIYNLKNS